MRIRQKKVGVAYWAKVRKDVIFIPSLARDEERFRQNVCDHVSTILQFCKQKSLFFLVQDRSLCLFLTKRWEMTRKYVQERASAVANCGTEGGPHWYIRTLKDPPKIPQPVFLLLLILLQNSLSNGKRNICGTTFYYI